MIRLTLALALASVAFGAEQPRLPDYGIKPLRFPPASNAQVSRLAKTDSGEVWAAFASVAASGPSVSATFLSATTPQWSPAVVIGTAPTPVEGAPSIAFAGSNGLVMWSAGEQIYLSASHDHGKTWEQPRAATGAHGHFPVVCALADGGFAAIWLEKTPTPNAPSLAKVQAERLAPNGKARPVATLARDACDCCTLSVSAFPDGGAILAYRTLDEQQDRDVHYLRLHAGAWGESRIVSSDGWRSLVCPGAGPQLSTDGGRVAAIWFTGADDQPRLLTSGSPDAGERFLMPLRLDGGASDGTPDITILHDGAAIAVWAEDTTGHDKRSFWLRRITPDFTLQPHVPLGDGPTKTTMRAMESALVSDYAGGTADAALVVLAVFADGSQPASYLVTVPESGLLAAADPGCHCAPAPADLVGFPLRGRVVGRAQDSVTLSHGEIEGVLDEGTTTCRIDPAEAGQLAIGTGFLGRIERRAGAWWLYSVRVLGPAAP